jgi:hypothetical protein
VQADVVKELAQAEYPERAPCAADDYTTFGLLCHERMVDPNPQIHDASLVVLAEGRVLELGFEL